MIHTILERTESAQTKNRPKMAVLAATTTTQVVKMMLLVKKTGSKRMRKRCKTMRTWRTKNWSTIPRTQNVEFWRCKTFKYQYTGTQLIASVSYAFISLTNQLLHAYSSSGSVYEDLKRFYKVLHYK